MFAAFLALASALPASGVAGPRYILVHGGGLSRPVLLDDLAANELLVSSPDILPLAAVPRVDDRPAYELALFFIVPDLAGRGPAQLDPSETAAVGRFYPSVGTYDAVFELGAVPGIGPRRNGGLTPAMLDYLVSRGIEVASTVELGPERPSPAPQLAVDPALQPGSGQGEGSRWLLPSLVSAGLLVVMVVVFVSVGRRRKPRRGQLHW